MYPGMGMNVCWVCVHTEIESKMKKTLLNQHDKDSLAIPEGSDP